jgi:hypothetical protein
MDSTAHKSNIFIYKLSHITKITEEGWNMKIFVIALMAVIAVSVLSMGVMAAVSQGPAPSAGDCFPDGSGWGVDDLPSQGPGPAPNSGDGVNDGPGW